MGLLTPELVAGKAGSDKKAVQTDAGKGYRHIKILGKVPLEHFSDVFCIIYQATGEL